MTTPQHDLGQLLIDTTNKHIVTLPELVALIQAYAELASQGVSLSSFLGGKHLPLVEEHCVAFSKSELYRAVIESERRGD